MDDLIRLTLEHIFCKYPYEKVVDDFYKMRPYFNPIDKTTFILSIKTHISLYTDDSLELLYDLYSTKWIKCPEDKLLASIGKNKGNIFYSLLYFTNDVLRLKGNMAVVRFEQLLRWRELSYLVGEDLLISSFLAFQDSKTFIKRINFSWPAVAINDDIDIQELSRKKLAELHFHLKGSSDNFEISWICLMNHIYGRTKEFKELDKNPISFDSKADGTIFPPLYEKCIDAADLRLYLFHFLRNVHGLKFINNEHSYLYAIPKLQFAINIELDRSNCKINNYKYDYAIENTNQHNILDILSGERNLMYSLFKYIYENKDTNGKITIFFYRYLLAKAKFREELIQVNEQIGFGNFSKYELRKDLFIDKKEYKHYKESLSGIAIAESIQSHGVGYIEARITPKTNVNKFRQSIKQFDKEIKGINNNETSPNWYYICHFIKKKDSVFSQGEPWQQERHHNLREEIKKQIISLMRLREESPQVAQRILAIDAANSELHCRPEVFAQAYRYTRTRFKYTLPPDSIEREFLKYQFGITELQSLKYTFHAGEDFFDITDGLRAIDEAVCLLDLQHGDRLGHCLAMGIDPMNFYKYCHRSVVAPNLLFLDNIVWLKYKLRHYDIAISPIIEDFMENKYEELFFKIYGNNKSSTRSYYLSMRLRGDNPNCYINGRYKKPVMPIGWEATCLDSRSEAKESRDDENAVALYSQYHYNKKVRETGEEVSDFLLPEGFDMIIKELQDHMIDDLTNQQIIVECCPTSNFKIGHFHQYIEHPIFRFFDVGLSSESKHQLPVTINTDDQGIFATSLDNEYALIALALIKKKDKNGHHVYTRYQVLQWLKEIYNNGNKYKFMMNLRTDNKI